MNSSVGIMSLILLVLLFLKIPVFVAVLGASVVYFIMTPGINPAVFAQHWIRECDTSRNSVLCMCWCSDELHGRYETDHGLLFRTDRKNVRWAFSGKYLIKYIDGRTFRFRACGCGDGG